MALLFFEKKKKKKGNPCVNALNGVAWTYIEVNNVFISLRSKMALLCADGSIFDKLKSAAFEYELKYLPVSKDKGRRQAFQMSWAQQAC